VAESTYQKFRRLLDELFMMDRADLDFGIYRIMNAKRAEITRFFDQDLLPQVKESLLEVDTGQRLELQRQLQEVEQACNVAGIDPDTSQKVLDLRNAIKATGDPDALEAEVFSHLYDFFRRYYKDGDFISLRRYKEGVYAIPYEGEEVKLYWANHDQYYIKSGEYFRDYAFKLPDGRRVHFKLVQADEERDNTKAPAGQERRFILSESVEVREEPGSDGKAELVIPFEYRPDAEKRKQAELVAEAAKKVLAGGAAASWLSGLAAAAPTEKNSQRTLLEKHLAEYTARNTFDYFIHKDLGGFLRRELDFYIKNEVMHLDDIESEGEQRVTQYLAKIKAMRRIAHKIIDFLAQLEDFQKKLWLKKKFVVETNWCVTLDRVPEELYPEIAANEAQREEWVRLFAIDEIESDLTQPGYSEPLTVEFLRANQSLVLDTALFDGVFTDRLLSTFDDLDEQTDGLLIHSENFQALQLLQARYREQVKCIYIDPPYNTGNDGFAYKDNYQHSTWASLMSDRMVLGRLLLAAQGIQFVSIDDGESHNLRRLCDDLFSSASFVATLTWKSTTQPDNIGRARFGLQKNIEYVLMHSRCSSATLPPFLLEPSGQSPRYPHTGRFGACRFEIIERSFEGAYARPTMRFRILGQLPRDGKQWQIGEAAARELERQGRVEIVDGVVKRAIYPEDEAEAETGLVPFWAHLESTGTSQHGKGRLTDLVGRGHGFETVKPVSLLCGLLNKLPRNLVICDFFAGSGTTGDAVIMLNRQDGARRVFVLVESERYFGDLMVPRLLRLVHSPEWKGGRPSRPATAEDRERGPHLLKYLRLESYEDALNNLALRRDGDQDQLLAGHPDLREDYTLRYMLDVESAGSASLLNLDRFEEPFDYTLQIGQGSVGETRPVKVDLVETFNYLIGLRVKHVDSIRGFKVVEGASPQGDRVLVIWRNTREKSNEELDEFFQKQGYNTRDSEFDVIYVNGDNNLENLRRPDETWKVRLIEDDFKRLMFDVEDV
jgi:adenine-specific DNA-methyltransferase